MSQMEWILIICAVVIPFIAILFVLPKRKKKSKVPPPTTDYVREDKVQAPKEQQLADAPKQEQPKQVKPPVYLDTDDDFKSYLELRNKKIKPAEPKEQASFVRSTSGDYIPARLRTSLTRNAKEKSVAEQIQDLSPELKALIVSGVLDKKF